jgi:alpha-tubulin suppressor-like RCC1 family protein
MSPTNTNIVSPEETWCSATTMSRLFCLGRNSEGALGNGTMTPYEPMLSEVLPSGVWSSVSTGVRHTCAVRTARTLWCWGEAPENGVGVRVATPTQVGTATNWQWVDAQDGYTCGMRDDGALYCWGRPDTPFLQAMGLAAPSPMLIPVTLDPGMRPRLGGTHACARIDGTWQCWGSNLRGQVGVDSTALTIAEPVPLCPR